MQIELGAFVRDAVTGFEGVAIGRAEYLAGCERVLVQPRPADARGIDKIPEAEWLDTAQLEQLRTPAVRLPGQDPVDTSRPAVGGPRDKEAPKR